MKFKKILAVFSVLVVSAFTLTAAYPVDYSTPVIKTPPKVLVSLGDSITQAANACEPWKECPEVSWSTGNTPDPETPTLLKPTVGTFKEHIEELNKEPITVHNNARSYTKVDDLPNQAQIAVTQKAEFVTILSGANDLCALTEQEITSPEAFKAYLAETLTILNTQLPKTKIFIASIPNIYNLWEKNHTNPTAVNKWDDAKLCWSMLENATSNEKVDRDRRERVSIKLQEFNNIIQETCGEANNCLTDENRVYNTSFNETDLSPVDFFHPNIQGQNKLASVTWNSQVEYFSYIERGKSTRTSENAPIISVLEPTNNSTISGTYRLKVEIEHVNSLKKVYADTQLGGVELKWDKITETWYLEVDTTLAPNNLSTTFTVVAVDEKDEVATSERITVKVFNPPVIEGPLNEDGENPTPSPSTTEENQELDAMFSEDQ